MERTWDGKPISPDAPYGATVVIYRRTTAGPELLLLHRAHNGPEYEGDWAWTPPAGARQPGESVEECAERELREEAGITASIRAVDGNGPEWFVYCAEVGPGVEVVLHDREHDRYEWVPLEEALRRCRPERVAEGIRRASRLMEP